MCSSNFRTFSHQILKSESSALYGKHFHEGLASLFSEEASPEVQPQAAAECGELAKFDKAVNKVVDEDDTKAVDK